MDLWRFVITLVLLGVARGQNVVPTSLQGVDKNEPPPPPVYPSPSQEPPGVQPSTAPVKPPTEGAPQTGTGTGQTWRERISATEVGGVPVGQFATSEAKTAEGPVGGAVVAAVSQPGETHFTPIGMTGSGNTWAEALGYAAPVPAAPIGWAGSPAATEPQGVVTWDTGAQTPPSNTQQATPTGLASGGVAAGPVGGAGVGGGAGLLTGAGMGGAMGGLLGGLGGLEGMTGMGGMGANMLGLETGGLLGGLGAAGPGLGLLGGGASEGGLMGGLLGGLGGGAEGGLLGGMGGLLGGGGGAGNRRGPDGFASRSNRQTDMIRTMLMMRMLNGGDAPDPPPTPTGRAAGRRGRRMGPPSPLQQLMKLEQIDMIRQRQIERAMRNRMRPENQRGGYAGGQGPNPRDQSYQSQPPTFSRGGGRFPQRTWDVPHPEVLNRQNMPRPTPPPAGGQGQGPEPVEREPAQGQGQGRGQGQGQGQGRSRQQARADPWARQPSRGADMPGYTPSDPPPPEFPPQTASRPGNNVGMSGPADPWIGQQAGGGNVPSQGGFPNRNVAGGQSPVSGYTPTDQPPTEFPPQAPSRPRNNVGMAGSGDPWFDQQATGGNMPTQRGFPNRQASGGQSSVSGYTPSDQPSTEFPPQAASRLGNNAGMTGSTDPWMNQPARGGTAPRYTRPTAPMGVRGQQRGFPARRGAAGAQSRVPRNMRELMADPRFQRRLRLNTNPTPIAASNADARADRADRMADYMDNMQSMNPLARLMGGGMGGMGMGMPGMAGMMGGLPGMMGGAPGMMGGLQGMMGGLPGMVGGLPGLMGGVPGMPGVGGGLTGLNGGLGNRPGLVGMGATRGAAASGQAPQGNASPGGVAISSQGRGGEQPMGGEARGPPSRTRTV